MPAVRASDTLDAFSKHWLLGLPGMRCAYWDGKTEAGSALKVWGMNESQ